MAHLSLKTMWMISNGQTVGGLKSFKIQHCFIRLLLLYVSGNETEDASEVDLITVARKPEETCKQGCLLCEPETLRLSPSLPR